MSAPRRVSDDEIRRAYEMTGSIQRASAALGIHGSSVHERLVRLGIPRKQARRWAPDDDARLLRDYTAYRDLGRAGILAEEMGRTLPFLARQAGRLGLTDVRHPKPFAGRWKYMSEADVRLVLDEFKASSLGLGQWLARKGWADDGFRRAAQQHFPDEWDAVIESKALTGSMYRIGRAVEYRARDDLRRRGFYVMRSPRSQSPTDLVGFARGIVLFIQCKRSGTLPRGEWNALVDLAWSVGAVPLLASSPTGRGTVYMRLTDRKDGTRRRQPYEPYEPHV